MRLDKMALVPLGELDAHLGLGDAAAFQQHHSFQRLTTRHRHQPKNIEKDAVRETKDGELGRLECDGTRVRQQKDGI